MKFILYYIIFYEIYLLILIIKSLIFNEWLILRESLYIKDSRNIVIIVNLILILPLNIAFRFLYKIVQLKNPLNFKSIFITLIIGMGGLTRLIIRGILLKDMNNVLRKLLSQDKTKKIIIKNRKIRVNMWKKILEKEFGTFFNKETGEKVVNSPKRILTPSKDGNRKFEHMAIESKYLDDSGNLIEKRICDLIKSISWRYRR